MIKRSKDNTVGPWAKEKLEALGQYLNFYTTVLKNQRHWLRGTIFVDAFAGPGLSRVRTKRKAEEGPGLFGIDPESDAAEIEFLNGSPRVALDIANPFTYYVFIDRDPERITELNRLKNEYAGTRVIDVRAGDSNAVLHKWLADDMDWKYYRAVVFLDPFGMQVPWSTIELLASTKAIEVIVTFPLGMAVQRLLTRSGDIPEGWQISLDTFFGSPKWRQLAYEEGADLLGPTMNKVGDSGIKLLEWFRDRLRIVFGHVSTPRLIRNTRGNPLYYLIWAGSHRKGLDGAEHILSKGERVIR